MSQSDHLPTLSQVFANWHDFYLLLGTASATLVGLLFVAATVAAGVFTGARRAALRVFLSASVIHFSTILIACLVVLAPNETWVSLGSLIAACGIFGMAYYALMWRDSVRDGLATRIDLEDRIWYALMPTICYLFETASGVAVLLRVKEGCAALALSVGLLLIVGIHNAWDITVWSVTRHRD